MTMVGYCYTTGEQYLLKYIYMTAWGKPLHIIDIITIFNNDLPHCTLTLSKRHSFFGNTRSILTCTAVFARGKGWIWGIGWPPVWYLRLSRGGGDDFNCSPNRAATEFLALHVDISQLQPTSQPSWLPSATTAQGPPSVTIGRTWSGARVPAVGLLTSRRHRTRRDVLASWGTAE